MSIHTVRINFSDLSKMMREREKIVVVNASFLMIDSALSPESLVLAKTRTYESAFPLESAFIVVITCFIITSFY